MRSRWTVINAMAVVLGCTGAVRAPDSGAGPADPQADGVGGGGGTLGMAGAGGAGGTAGAAVTRDGGQDGPPTSAVEDARGDRGRGVDAMDGDRPPAISADAAMATLCARGGLMFEEAFTQTSFRASWGTGAGSWQIVDDSLRGAELATQDHQAVARHQMAYQDVIIQLLFKLEGAQSLAVGFEANGHLARAVVTDRSFHFDRVVTVGGLTDSNPLVTKRAPLQPGQWHTMIVELCGNRFAMHLPGVAALQGESADLDVAKKGLNLLIKGESAWVDDFRVWAARRGQSP